MSVQTSQTFGTRVGGVVQYNSIPGLHPGPPKTTLGRTFGFKMNDLLRDILDSPFISDNDGEIMGRVRERVQCTGLKSNGENPEHSLYFPFLIVSSKSPKSTDSSQDIENQNAMPIQNFLGIQRQLQELSNQNKVHLFPLVWFISYKGEDWKLYKAYYDGERLGGEWVSIARDHYFHAPIFQPLKVSNITNSEQCWLRHTT